MATIRIGYYERVKGDEVLDAGSLTVEAEIEIEKGHWEKIGEYNDYVGHKIKSLEITEARFLPIDSTEEVELPTDEVEDYIENYVNEHIQNYI